MSAQLTSQTQTGSLARPDRSRGAWALRAQDATEAVARRIDPSPLTLDDELRLDQLGNDSGGVAAGEELAHGLASAGTEIERPIVDIHADKCVGLSLVKAAAELQRVFERRLPMNKTIFDALLQQAIDVVNCGLAEVYSHSIGAERQRQARFFHPPLPEIHHEMQILIAVGELPFVNDQARVDR